MKKAMLIIFITLIAFDIMILASLIPTGHESGEGNHFRFSSWSEVSNTPFTGGYGESVVGDGNNIYIMRQYKAGQTVYFYRYDVENDSWTDLSSNVPDVDFKNGVAMAYDYSRYIYVMNGSAYSDDADKVGFFRYDIKSNAWEQLKDTPHVQGAGDALVYSGYDHMLYALIGRAHYTGSYHPGDYSSFARYNPATNTWENLSFPDWPGTDDGASLAWTGGKYIYALEGEFYENSPIRHFARYDIDADTWENMTDIPAQDGVGDGGSLLWIGYYDSAYSNVIFAFDGNGCNETPGYNFTMYYTNNDTWVHVNTFENAPVGDYVGNRLAYAKGKIYYWQGTPSTWQGGGEGVYSYDYSEISVPEFSSLISIVPPLLIAAIGFVYFRERT